MLKAPEFNRTLPAVSLVFLTALLAFHHWYAVTEHHAYVFVVFVVPMFWALALGGLVYPPIFWSIGPRGKDLPTGIKAIGAVLALGGLGIGFLLAKSLYGF
jgi:hypothetical protein